MPYPTRFAPTPRDLQILAALHSHRRMTASQIRRLFFRQDHEDFAAIQTVHARLRRLQDLGYIDSLVVDRGRGSGPLAYGLTPAGRAAIGAMPRRRGHPGPLQHDLQMAELRVNLELGLQACGGRLIEWVGEGELRSILKSDRGPKPDGMTHWELDGHRGFILWELDLGTEPFGQLAAKLPAYERWFRERGYRRLVEGMEVRPQLALIAPHGRCIRLAAALRPARPLTALVGRFDEVLAAPLRPRWLDLQTGCFRSLAQGASRSADRE